MQGMRKLLLVVLMACLPSLAQATRVNVVGLFPGKAVVSIDGGAPRTLAVGKRTPEGVMLISTSGETAVMEIDGKRSTLGLGQAYAAQDGGAVLGGGDSVTLTADSQGHYHTVGAINGRATQFLVDTGAGMVWLSSELANRLGVAYQRGRTFTVTTAGGQKTAWAVMLDTVRIGPVSLDHVEAAVGEGAGTGETALLGMTFMSRLSMQRDGGRLVLSRKENGDAQNSHDQRPQLTLSQGKGGSFATTAIINGTSLPVLVDTGATNVSIDIAMAQRIGLDYTKGTPGLTSTANGTVRVWRVKFDSVSVGPITMYNVDGNVREGDGIGIGLLGMSFLSRVEMRRDGTAMTLIKRF
jgi:aspartyl protease family protein